MLTKGSTLDCAEIQANPDADIANDSGSVVCSEAIRLLLRIVDEVKRETSRTVLCRKIDLMHRLNVSGTAKP